MSNTRSVRGLRRTVDPTTEPVSVEELLNHMKMGQVLEGEVYLKDIITGAREDAEEFMRRSLITQTWLLTLDFWNTESPDWWDALHSVTYKDSDRYLELPYAPLQSVASVTTYDTEDNATSVTVDDVFFVDTNSVPGRLSLRSGQSWPANTRLTRRVEVVYKAGYGAGPLNVPRKIRMGIMKHAAWEYQHRGDECEDKPSIVLSGAASNYYGFKVLKL